MQYVMCDKIGNVNGIIKNKHKSWWWNVYMIGVKKKW